MAIIMAIIMAIMAIIMAIMAIIMAIMELIGDNLKKGLNQVFILTEILV